MIAGFLVLGVAAGMVSGGTALIAGHPLWVAGLVYVLGGVTGFALGAVLAARADGADPAGHD